jgi:hypothetical protein
VQFRQRHGVVSIGSRIPTGRSDFNPENAMNLVSTVIWREYGRNGASRTVETVLIAAALVLFGALWLAMLTEVSTAALPLSTQRRFSSISRASG